MSPSTARWILHRFLHAIALLLGISLLSFLLGRMAPGSFFDDLKLNPQISAETIAQLESRYGIAQPFAVRYAAWLASSLRGDFGTSIAYHQPASVILLPRAIQTLKLTVAAAAGSWLLALPLAILAALRPRGPVDLLASAASTVLLAIPELLLALFVLAVAGRFQLNRAGASLLPAALVLIAGGFPVVFRHTRSALAEAENETYLRAARAHGIRGARLWILYILPAAANPLISLLGLWIGGLIGGSLLVETILSRPGLGPLFLEAVGSRDLDIVTAVMLISATFLIGGNLLAELLLGAIDPRVRSFPK
jgi:peptide/nickel transport system permease protein